MEPSSAQTRASKPTKRGEATLSVTAWLCSIGKGSLYVCKHRRSACPPRTAHWHYRLSVPRPPGEESFLMAPQFFLRDVLFMGGNPKSIAWTELWQIKLGAIVCSLSGTGFTVAIMSSLAQVSALFRIVPQTYKNILRNAPKFATLGMGCSTSFDPNKSTRESLILSPGLHFTAPPFRASSSREAIFLCSPSSQIARKCPAMPRKC